MLAVRELGAIADTILQQLGPGPVQMGLGPNPVPQYTPPEKALVQLGLDPDRMRAARREDAHEFIVRNLADQRF